MSAVADTKGLKRVCVGCGIHFYDMNKRPVKCPKCDEEFTGEAKNVKGRRGRNAATGVPVKKKKDAANDKKKATDIKPKSDEDAESKAETGDKDITADELK